MLAWLEKGYHGEMDYMARHGLKRARPAELVPGTVRVITVLMNYLPRTTSPDWRNTEKTRLQNPHEGIISLYARGRDYHKVLRQRLQHLAQAIADRIQPMGFRVFTDSAPVMEVELATRSAQGWRGKHTLLLNRQAGSMFFLGEIYVDIPLPLTPPTTLVTFGTSSGTSHCGGCTACIAICPTQAIVAPYHLDARRCISYLTIEYAGSIPLELRPLIGNRIYGCDDCQLVCPWNKFARVSTLPDFDAREGLTGSMLVDLFGWTETEFLRRTEGSPIRRIGHERWLRNIAVALGNAASHPASIAALKLRAQHPSPLVREHIAWALTTINGD
ncbi:MAG: tRNA epoxyqueuosine(34) reductase QueG [Pseudomonadota bacterium]